MLQSINKEFSAENDEYQKTILKRLIVTVKHFKQKA